MSAPAAPVPIQHRHDWPIIITGATLLTIHAVAFFSLGSPVSHMTGHYTSLGMLSEQGRVRDTAWVFGLLLSFCIGCMISGALIGQSKFIAIQPYVFDHDMFILYPLAVACGMQNGMVTTWSGAVVRTTHFTGTITDTGLVIGHWLRYKLNLKEEWEPGAADTWKLMLFFPMMAGFVTGGFLGTLTYNYLDYWALLFPALSIGMVGLIYRWLKRESKYFAYYRYKKVLGKKLEVKEDKKKKHNEESVLIPFKMTGKVYPFRTPKKKTPEEEMSLPRKDTDDVIIEMPDLASPAHSPLSTHSAAHLVSDLIELDPLEEELREAEEEERQYLEFNSYLNQQEAFEQQRREHPELFDPSVLGDDLDGLHHR